MCLYYDIVPGDAAIYLDGPYEGQTTCIHVDHIVTYFWAHLRAFSGVGAQLCMWFRMLSDPDRSGWVVRLHHHHGLLPRRRRNVIAPLLIGVDLFPTLYHPSVGSFFDDHWRVAYQRLGVPFLCASLPTRGQWHAERIKTQTMAELKEACEAPPPPAFFVAVDTEGLGANQRLYPTVAVAFAVFDEHGKLHDSWKINFPYEVSEKCIEPRCWREFWNNPEKCDPKVYQQLVNDCKAAQTTYETVGEAWAHVRKVIDGYYYRFDSPGQPLTWVSDCPDYDVGRIDAGLSFMQDGDDTGLRYRMDGGDRSLRHRVADCGTGKDALKQLRPCAYLRFKAELDASSYKKNHDCLEDAKRIGFEYVTFVRTLKKCVPRGGAAKRKAAASDADRLRECNARLIGVDPYGWLRVGALASFAGIAVRVRRVTDKEVELIAVNSSALYVLFRQDHESMQKLVPFTAQP
jgi:hypothetical protein